MVRQEAEPDTVYLLDADAEPAWAPGAGGLIMANASSGDVGWQPSSKVVAVDGKYRRGLQSVNRAGGYMWMPSVGLLSGAEFAVEMWLKSTVDWARVNANTPFSMSDAGGAVTLRITANAGKLKLSYGHLQDPAGPVDVSLAYDLKVHPLAANVWHNVAFTLKDGVLDLYVNGVKAAERTGIKPARVWSDSADGDGLSILGKNGLGADKFAISDLRISHKARTVGAVPADGSTNTLTVGQPAEGSVQPLLLGTLHSLGGATSEGMALGTVQTIRTDKLLTATPIKAGDPDEAHPTRGVSGSYSYDWQVVDRTLDYLRRLGVTPYISIDSTPQILGGSVAPYSGDQLMTARAGSSRFAPEVPNDMTAFGLLVRDLVYHVVIEKGYEVPYWGVWNEPNLPGFWKGTQATYLSLYEVAAQAVKSVDPTLKVGGPETANWQPSWAKALITRAAKRGLPLDFISWHPYLRELVEIARVRAQTDRWSTDVALGRSLELINGESAWQQNNTPVVGKLPWRDFNYFINDWHAALTAATLIEEQRAGVRYHIYTHAVAEATQHGLNASGLMSSTQPWANLNVYRLWSKLGPELLSTSYDGRPGVFTLASRDASGRTTILVAYLVYRKDAPVDLRVDVGPSSLASNVTHYVVDDEHSNAYDAGAEHAELETVTPPSFSLGAANITLRPRSVHLLVIDPSTG